MRHLNIVVEGSSEESFVNDILVGHFAPTGTYVSARKIKTGWDRIHNKPAKGGLLKYRRFRDDVLRWIQSDRNSSHTWYTSMLDLYAFPRDNESPYEEDIQRISDPYLKVERLEAAIAADINHERFIPYVQLHEFETFLLVDPGRLIKMYPDRQASINRIKRDIAKKNPEEINESPQASPSKRIIKHLPQYEFQKAQVGPLVAEDIGLTELRSKCSHFNKWINTLEALP